MKGRLKFWETSWTQLKRKLQLNRLLSLSDTLKSDVSSCVKKHCLPTYTWILGGEIGRHF